MSNINVKDIMQKAQQGINLPDGGQNIYVFSLEGKQLRKYVLEHYIHGISVDEQKGVVIAMDVNRDEPIIEYHYHSAICISLLCCTILFCA